MPPVKSKSRIGEANLEKILDAALSVFARYGFRGARTDQIAEAAGMSKPNLLYYFRTKEELYVAVLQRTLDRWLEPLGGLTADSAPEAALADLIGRKLASALSHPEQSRLFATEVIQGAPMLKAALVERLAPLVAAKTEVIGAWIRAGRLAPVDPVTLIFVIWATTQHYADFAAQVQVLTGRTLDDPDFFATTRDSITAILLRGVLPR